MASDHVKYYLMKCEKVRCSSDIDQNKYSLENYNTDCISNYVENNSIVTR